MTLAQSTPEALQARTADGLARHPSAPRRGVTWHEPPDIVLDETGTIQKCSRSFGLLFGYRGADLADHHISMLFPQLSAEPLLKDGQLSPKVDFLCRCGHLFLAQDCRGHIFKSELSFVRMRADGHPRIRLIMRHVADKGMRADR